MATSTTEERLTALETEVTRLRTKIEGERYGVIGRTHPDFLRQYVGKSANNPVFEEVMQSIADVREREFQAAETDISPSEAEA